MYDIGLWVWFSKDRDSICCEFRAHEVHSASVVELGRMIKELRRPQQARAPTGARPATRLRDGHAARPGLKRCVEYRGIGVKDEYVGLTSVHTKLADEFAAACRARGLPQPQEHHHDLPALPRTLLPARCARLYQMVSLPQLRVRQLQDKAPGSAATAPAARRGLTHHSPPQEHHHAQEATRPEGLPEQTRRGRTAPPHPQLHRRSHLGKLVWRGHPRTSPCSRPNAPSPKCGFCASSRNPRGGLLMALRLQSPATLVVVVVGIQFRPGFWAGRVFTVTRLHDPSTRTGDRPPQRFPGVREPLVFHDACLRPLRDSDGEDEMLRLAGKPNPTHPKGPCHEHPVNIPWPASSTAWPSCTSAAATSTSRPSSASSC